MKHRFSYVCFSLVFRKRSQQHTWYPQHVHGHHNGSAVVPYHNHVVLDIINAAGMDETYGTYVVDECFDIHDYDDDTDQDTDE